MDLGLSIQSESSSVRFYLYGFIDSLLFFVSRHSRLDFRTSHRNNGSGMESIQYYSLLLPGVELFLILVIDGSNYSLDEPANSCVFSNEMADHKSSSFFYSLFVIKLL